MKGFGIRTLDKMVLVNAFRMVLVREKFEGLQKAFHKRKLNNQLQISFKMRETALIALTSRCVNPLSQQRLVEGR